MPKICNHCKKTINQTFPSMMTVGGHYCTFCDKCFKDWFIIRDQVVKDALNEYISYRQDSKG